jgi:hypothetical protein
LRAGAGVGCRRDCNLQSRLPDLFRKVFLIRVRHRSDHPSLSLDQM